VQTEVVVDDGLAGRGRLTVLRMSWRRDDPLAVTLLLTGHPDHPSLPRGEWVVLRDFLRYGLEEPTGDGEVRIAPIGDGRVQLDLMRGDRPYSIPLACAVVDDFLTDTERIVPAGEEASEEALDALIERLLER
jgi:hypothetical protein